jgi:hypothetical protein
MIAVPIRTRAESRKYTHRAANGFSVRLILELRTCQIPGPAVGLTCLSLRLFAPRGAIHLPRTLLELQK